MLLTTVSHNPHSTVTLALKTMIQKVALAMFFTLYSMALSPFLYFANVDHMMTDASLWQMWQMWQLWQLWQMWGCVTCHEGVSCVSHTGALHVDGTGSEWLLAWGTTTKWIFRALLRTPHTLSAQHGRKRNTLKHGSSERSVLNKDASWCVWQSLWLTFVFFCYCCRPFVLVSDIIIVALFRYFKI